MKLLLITVRSDYGGGPRHIDQLVNNLPDEIELYLAYPENGEPYANLWKSNQKIQGCIYIPYRRFSLLCLLRLYNFIKLNNIDIVHSHGNGAGLYSRLLKSLSPSLRVVHTYHGISDEYSSKLKSLVSKLIGCMLAQMADLYVCVSNGEKMMAIDRRFSKEENTVVIYNGIPDPFFTDCRDINHCPLKIVTLSRYDYQKNMDSMYRIAKHWAGSEDVRFVWVGDGKDKERLERQAKTENVPIDFIGFTTEPMKYLQSSDLYLSTSRFEGLPYGLIEAASVGLPIIASDVKGNNEVVSHGYNGFLFHEESEAVTLIDTILNDNGIYKKMSANSAEIFKKNFREDNMIDSVVNIYKKMIIR